MFSTSDSHGSSAFKAHARSVRIGLILTGLFCVLLFVISGFGLWLRYKMIDSLSPFDVETTICVQFVIVMPIILAFIVAVVTTRRHERDRISISYQARLNQMQERLNAQEDFVRVITDHTPEAIAIFDQDNHYWFVNAAVALDLKRTVKDIVGQPVQRVLSKEQARLIEKRLKEVIQSGKPLETLEQKTDPSGQLRFIQTRFEKMPAFGIFSGGIISRSEDVTNLLVERERRENMLRQVINTLVAVVDRRDPYATGHSARVGQLSKSIAQEMILSEREIETAEVAGSLMNFGKALVPREILTKTTALTPDELQRVRDSILVSADILSIIDFPTPVVPTLRQVLERYDGSGVPQGLKGDDIVVTARIVAVANAFIALVSARAHRVGLEPTEAVRRMTEDANTVYDPSVIKVLDSYIKSHGSKIEWLRPTGKV